MVASPLSHSLALTEGRDQVRSHFQFPEQNQRQREAQNMLAVNSVLIGAERVVLARVGLGYHLVCDWPIAQVLDDDQVCSRSAESPVQILPHADLTLERALPAGPLRPGQPHLHEAGA